MPGIHQGGGPSPLLWPCLPPLLSLRWGCQPPPFPLGVTPWSPGLPSRCSAAPLSATLSPVSPCLSLRACFCPALARGSPPRAPFSGSPVLPSSRPPSQPPTGGRDQTLGDPPTFVNLALPDLPGWSARQDKALLRRLVHLAWATKDRAAAPPGAGARRHEPRRRPPRALAPRPSPPPPSAAPPLRAASNGRLSARLPASCFRGHQSAAAPPLCWGIDGGREGVTGPGAAA